MDNKNKDGDLIEKLKAAFDTLGPIKDTAYPKEAMPLGTYVRATRHDKLGVITDAFYGELDLDNNKIIVYTILLFPDSNPYFKTSSSSEQYYVSNEYEYEVIGYLMMPPANLAALTANLGGGLFL
jgi:hypothetical protein